ncbi:unnamed protein product, partial [Brenthis ino]
MSKRPPNSVADPSQATLANRVVPESSSAKPLDNESTPPNLYDHTVGRLECLLACLWRLRIGHARVIVLLEKCFHCFHNSLLLLFTMRVVNCLEYDFKLSRISKGEQKITALFAPAIPVILRLIYAL